MKDTRSKLIYIKRRRKEEKKKKRKTERDRERREKRSQYQQQLAETIRDTSQKRHHEVPRAHKNDKPGIQRSPSRRACCSIHPEM
jgi:hypothetical protein